MLVRKTHLYIAAAVAIIAIAYAAQRYEWNKQLSEQRDTTIALCGSSVERSSYIANGFRLMQRAGGDPKNAKNYGAVADSIISTFPGIAKLNPQVDRIETFDNKIVFRIPDATRDRQHQACVEAFEKGVVPATKTP